MGERDKGRKQRIIAGQHPMTRVAPIAMETKEYLRSRVNTSIPAFGQGNNGDARP